MTINNGIWKNDNIVLSVDKIINAYHNEELLWNPELNANEEAKEQAWWGSAAFLDCQQLISSTSSDTNSANFITSKLKNVKLRQSLTTIGYV